MMPPPSYSGARYYRVTAKGSSLLKNPLINSTIGIHVMHQALFRSLWITVLFSISVTLTACCDRQSQEQSKITAVPVAPAAPQPPAAPPPESYPATLAEGIDFTKPGYPTFIAEATGVSGHEPWGRWTDGNNAVFRFTQPLPKQFTLVIQTNAFGPNLGEVTKIKIGTAEQGFKITEQDQTYHLNFNLTEPANTIEFLIPKPSSPKELQVGDDPRKLGIGLIKLQIFP